MMLPFTFKRSSVRAGRLDHNAPIRPRLNRLFGLPTADQASMSAGAVSRIEDHDLNDVGLARGAVPHAVWEWRRRSHSRDL